MKKNPKRVFAIIGLILIGIVIMGTLITALIDVSGLLFRSFLILTITLPIALWVFLWAFGAMTHRHTSASFDLALGNSDADSENMEKE